ncbi:G5 domain-containing protein [bacterium]|nr:G5 domain-containing protein [bacterium]
MKLYQFDKIAVRVLLLLVFGFLIVGCGPVQSSSSFEVVVQADGENMSVVIAPGTTVREAIDTAGFDVGTLDKSDPPFYSVLEPGDTVVLTRVKEEYEVEQSVIPYDTQVLRNESLAEGEQRLIQPGANGLQETTYRVLYEDGVETSRTISGTLVVTESTPEIIMIGSQAPFSVLPIPGILAYISAGNAWIMRENTGVREPIVTTGDLDGRVFSISPDGRWLLYSRSGEGDEVINTLWVAKIDSEEGLEYDLGVENIIHYANWIPGSSTGIVYSTAEVTSSPPGWQANNDLYTIFFSEESGWTTSPKISLEPNSGGLYGWWGTDFLYSIDGERLAYSRPDGFGIVNVDYDLLNELVAALPVQTRSDWAWIPPIAWSPDANFIYYVEHVPQEGVTVEEDSEVFNLAVYPFIGGAPVSIVKDVGMFAYPEVSPLREDADGREYFSVAFLQALSPRQSRDSLYQLMVMDQDGSNLRRIFPEESGQGFSPADFYWLPWYALDEYPLYVGIINQGDLWLVDADTGEAVQLTDGGLVTALDWK